jgi:hypothetical protein
MGRTRWLVLLVVVCLSVAVAAVVYAATVSATSAPTTVRAQRFELVDSAGKVRAVLSLASPMPRQVRVVDREGNVVQKRVLTQPEDSVSLSLLDGKGRQRASISLDNDGNPQLALRGSKGEDLFTAPLAAGTRMLTR